MHGFRRWMSTAPLTVHFSIMAVSFGAITAGLGSWLDRPPRGPWWEHAIGGLFYGALMTALAAHRRRKDGGAERQWSVRTAIRRGELPDGADAREWEPVLERKAAEFRRYRVLNGVVFGLLTLLAVTLAVTEGPRWWAFVAFFAVFAAFGVVASRRAVRRIERMQQSLGPTQDVSV